MDLSGELTVMKRRVSKRTSKRTKTSLRQEMAPQTDSGSEW